MAKTPEIVASVGAVTDSDIASTHDAKRDRKCRRRDKAQAPVLRIVTNLPGVLPVLPAEVASVTAWWPTIANAIVADDDAVTEKDE